MKVEQKFSQYCDTVFRCVYISWSLIVGRSFTKLEIPILLQPCVQAESPGHVSIVKLGLHCVSDERVNDSKLSAVVVVDKCRGQRLRQTWQLQGRRTRGGEHIYSSAFLWIGLLGTGGCRSTTPSPTHPPVSLVNASTCPIAGVSAV